MPGGANTASGSLSTPSLSGTWQGDNGDVLVIRGDRFRIYDGESFYNDGTFRIVGNQLLIYAPTSGIVRRYQFAYRGNQLALRDSAGQVLSFRRLDESFPRYKKRIIM